MEGRADRDEQENDSADEAVKHGTNGRSVLICPIAGMDGHVPDKDGEED